jgi:hypothetical protein
LDLGRKLDVLVEAEKNARRLRKTLPAIFPSWRAHSGQLEIDVEEAIEWTVITGPGDFGRDADNNARS